MDIFVVIKERIRLSTLRQPINSTTMKKRLLFWILITGPLVWSCANHSSRTLSLAGEWKVSLDSANVGVEEKWFQKTLEQPIILPGSLAGNGYGREPGLNTPWVGSIVDSTWFKLEKFAKYRTPYNFKPPMWLTPSKYYRGVAWYQREFDVPSEWEDTPIELFLERCHWETQVWIDHKKTGTRNSLATPHVYELGKLPAGKHTVTIRVNNDLIVDVGINSHSVSDHTQTNWNGIIGRIELRSLPVVRLESLKIIPDTEKKQAKILLQIRNESGGPFQGKLLLSATSSEGKDHPAISVDVKAVPGRDSLSVVYDLGDEAKRWSEFDPVWYRLHAVLQGGDGLVADSLSDTFGLRQLTVKGKTIELNGHPLFLRGTLECAIFPLTGYPSMDDAYWRKIFTTARAHGLNHVRFHSWCPPEVAFQVADAMGFYLQVECGSWANQSTTIGDGKPVDQFVKDESERIVREYGNHPSFCLMAYGNEPAGANHKTFLANFEKYWKEKDSRRLYTSAAGWPILEENDYDNIPGPRIQRWGEGLNSIINAEPPRTDYDWSDRIAGLDKPVISHEIGQWCVYPNFEEIDKYTGVLQARNFEMFRETLQENHLGDLADDFVRASGKLQTLCYKADIEAALRTPGFAGFQLLDLHDFPGQGTALVGVLDAFWDSKGYVTPEAYSRFCSQTVPLARIPKLVIQQNENFHAAVEFAHFGPAPLSGKTVYWRLEYASNHQIISNGQWTGVSIPLGNNLEIGSVDQPLDEVRTPAKLKFIVGIDGTSFENDWDVWVYPAQLDVEEPGDVVITSSWPQARTALDSGQKVLFTIEKGNLKPEAGGNVAVGFSSIFWNTSWTRGQAPHTLGVLCDPDDPIFQSFPTDFHTNWEWWELLHDAQAMVLDDFPATLDPTVKMIDTWFSNRRLALLFEAKAGHGKLIVCSMNLSPDGRPVARQLRHSILRYMHSRKFNPTVAVDEKQISKLLK